MVLSWVNAGTHALYHRLSKDERLAAVVLESLLHPGAFRRPNMKLVGKQSSTRMLRVEFKSSTPRPYYLHHNPTMTHQRGLLLHCLTMGQALMLLSPVQLPEKGSPNLPYSSHKACTQKRVF